MEKKKINSKNKGSKNERSLAKLFEKWTGYEFSRTPSSGGLRWSNTDSTVGDLICSDKQHSRYFRFSVEAKFHRDINFEQLLLPNKNKKILEFWGQALEDSERSGKVPLLFMRYNGMPKDLHFAAISYNAYSMIFKKSLQKVFKKSGMRISRFIVGDVDIIIIPSTALFETKYKMIHKNAKIFLRNG